MIDRGKILTNLRRYDLKNVKIGVIASHSALDVCDGAKSEGFTSVAICQNGREKTFDRYFKSTSDRYFNRGCVDKTIILNRFNDILDPHAQEKLIGDNILFVPNRSFVSYCGINAVENDFEIPIVGSRNLLRSEERGGDRDYYWILDKAKLPFPAKVETPEQIDDVGLTIIKVHHKQKKLERGFFTAKSYEQFCQKSSDLIRNGVIEEDFLEHARMERYVIGPVFNLDFFYSPLMENGEKIELLGIDWRFESSLDGFCRLPGKQQVELEDDGILPEYTVCGHNSATLRESLLEKAFELAEKYVSATKKYYNPGIIGPFCLQTCVDKDLNFYIYDVAPRIGGGTNIHMATGHAYANSLWRRQVSTGRRLSMEIKRAIDEERIDEIVT
ncbi:MAG: formate--phosphoribosylaminoimidazolecarboxamide ligase family protein [archaeon]|nr:formate--phosphoribosylaminoimidazolecarboxamide ligase family protein [archaeon]